MPTGRPLKFASTEDSFLDVDLRETFNSNFVENEIGLENFVIDRIDSLFLKITGEGIQSIERQRILPRGVNRSRSKAREDAFITSASGKKYIVEFKHPSKSIHGLAEGVAQLLSYHLAEERCGTEITGLILISCRHDPLITEVLKRYALPIHYVLVNDQGTCFFSPSPCLLPKRTPTL